MKDDRIFRSTRMLALFVVPFLILAFIILYFFPGTSAERFAWAIKPDMTAMFMGAGYIGGAWLFINVIFGSRWHRVAAGFPPVTTFASAMLLATILHWEIFDLSHLPFILWLGLYVFAPILVIAAYLNNRGTDPGTPLPGSPEVPALARNGLRGLGILLLIFALGGFFSPNWLMSIWPWTLSPLTARVISGWFALIGVGDIVIARDPRWSAWKVSLQSIGLWQVLVLLAAARRPGDFTTGPINWYTLSVFVVVLGMIVLYIIMERQNRSNLPGTGVK